MTAPRTPGWSFRLVDNEERAWFSHEVPSGTADDMRSAINGARALCEYHGVAQATIAEVFEDEGQWYEATWVFTAERLDEATPEARLLTE
jgi:hypothetical protein